MLPLQIVLSITSMVTHNCLLNKSCKKDLPTQAHIYHFNILSYVVCILLFGILTLQSGLSWYTLLIGILFGVITALSAVYKMLALSNGPMHVTLLITTSSMILPALSGIFFGESFSLPKLAIIGILLFFIYLSLDKGDDAKINKLWFLYCSLAFVLQGSIGILQKVHQSSEYKSEAGGFLFIAFICSLLYSSLRAKRSYRELGFGKKHVIFSVVAGLCIFAMNYLNLKLSGILPSQLFFPVVNGSAIVLSTLASVFLFKEKLSKKQIIGLCGGFLALIAICLVP